MSLSVLDKLIFTLPEYLNDNIVYSEISLHVCDHTQYIEYTGYTGCSRISF